MVGLFLRQRAGASILALGLVTLSHPRPAAADGLFPEITVSRNGNISSQLPLDKPFILTGDVDASVSVVRAVFVRYAFRPWNFPPTKKSPLRTCAEVYRAVESGGLRESPALGLALFRDVFNTTSTTASDPARQAEQTAGAVGRALKALDQPGVFNVLSLMTAPVDEPAKDKTKKFSIQVSDRGFFRNGASYCLFLYQERPSGERLGEALLALAKEKLNAFQECRREGKPACPQLTELDAEVRERLKDHGLPADKLDAVEPVKVQTNLKEREENVVRHADALEHLLPGRPLVFEPGELLVLQPIPATPGDALYEAKQHLAVFVLQVLASNLAVHRQYAPDPQNPNFVKPEFIVDNFVVRAFSFEKDASALVLVGVEQKQRRELSSLEKHRLPGYPELGLLDVLELSRGRIIVDGSSVEFKCIRLQSDCQPVHLLLDTQSKAAETARNALRTRLKALTAVLDHMLGPAPLAASTKQVDKQGNGAGRSGTDMYDELKPWLAQIVEPSAPRRAEQLKRLRDELSNLALELAEYDEVAARLRELPAKFDLVSRKVLVEPLAQTPVSQAFGFAQTEFLSSYITPSLGLAYIAQAHEPFALPYVGAQIYLWPNRFDEPMWTNGRSDFRRMFALEVGLGLSGFPKYNSSFGSDDQYRPLSERYSTPPVLLGLAVQPLPYVTTTLGWALMRRTPSGLTRETPELFTSFFVSVTVQLNFFNAVRTLVLDQNSAALKPALFPASK